MVGRDAGSIDPDSGSRAGSSGGPVRFRTEPQPSLDSSERIWQGVYSYADGQARFRITIDVTLNRFTLQRSQGSDYKAMLRQLVGKAASHALQAAASGSRVEHLNFDIEIIGVKLTRVGAGVFEPGPGGDWFVVQAFVPGGSDSFLLGVNDHMAAGEFFVPRPESTGAVARELGKLLA